MLFTPAAAALLVRRIGGTDDEAVFLASVVPGESGGDPEIVNTRFSCGTENGRVLHAVGLLQICEYSSRGSRQQLQDPDHNAREALKILRSQGRSAWSATPDDGAADEARRALTEGAPMQEWMPGVRHVDRGGSVPVQDNGPTVVVLHTTETDRPASYSGTEPHFEVFDADGGTIQYISLARTAKALYNAPGGGETNRRRGRIIQIEIVWRAANAPNMPDSLLARVAAVIRFVREQFPGLQIVAPPQGFHGAEFGTIAIVDSPLRFSVQAWETFGGICGHQHVIENDHWDPGRIPFARLAALVGATTTPDQEDAMPPSRYIHDGSVWRVAGLLRARVAGPEENDLLEKLGSKMLDLTPAEAALLHASTVDISLLIKV